MDILTKQIPEEMANLRLDQALAKLFPDFSRSRLQQWLKNGHILINGTSPRPRDKVTGGELVELRPVLETSERWKAQALPLAIIHEDEELIIVDKPAGLVVHPAAGNPDGTLLNALLHHEPSLASLPRGGIVHRIDKDTTGLLVVARTLRTHKSLVEQLKEHTISRQYQAIVTGVMTAGGRIEAPIGRHPRHRTRMAVIESGKPAATNYRIVQRFRAHTRIKVDLESGRTHQIRVHMAHIHYPLLGDPVYAGRPHFPQNSPDHLIQALRGFNRQALHAARLELQHPSSHRTVSWESPLPEDLVALLENLEQDLKET
ncbi:MAG: 23S rRNA pseudouridine(1911/1915/1917) synthase RluD [Gammaproteobacteria bacterium]|nr:23S rRNA pseudouridine(1911/1915/1917) synthase RluD [Gammaproteobacteria bacterium]